MWNEGETLIFERVNNSNMTNGNTGFRIQIYFSEFSLFFCFIKRFCECNRVAIRNKGKIDCCTSHHVLCEMHIKLFWVFGGYNCCRKFIYIYIYITHFSLNYKYKYCDYKRLLWVSKPVCVLRKNSKFTSFLLKFI